MTGNLISTSYRLDIIVAHSGSSSRGAYEENVPARVCPSKFCRSFCSAAVCQSGLKGIETADLDRKADPCTDFYEYSNCAWRAQNPIPNSMDRWSRRWKAGEDNKDQLKIILDDLSIHEASK